MKHSASLAGSLLGCVLLSAPLSGSPAVPATQRQYIHPEAPYTEDFVWKDADLSGLGEAGRLLHWSQPDAGTVVLTFERAEARITAPQPGVLRLQVHEPGAAFVWPDDLRVGIRFQDFQPQLITVRETADTLALASADLRLNFARADFSLSLHEPDGKHLLTWQDLHFRRSAGGLRSYSRFALTAQDHFFGLGGKASPHDRRGTLADIYSVKVETKRGDYGGFSYPYFLNPRGYGFILNNPYPRVFFDFGHESDRQWTLTTPDGPLDVFFLAGATPQQITRRYHALTGAPAIPPRWMLGLWVSWLTNSSAEQWLEYMKRFRAEGWPADITVLDIYWRGGMVVFSEGGQGKNIEWDREKFGEGPTLLQKLHQENIHVALHVNTRMFADDTLKNGLDQHYLRESGHKQVVSVLETEPARDWNWKLYAPRVAEGTALWWVDNGERVDGILSNGLPSRNLYGEVWNQFLFEHMQKSGLQNRLVLARGGWLGTQTNSTQWPGDTGPGVERLREDLWFVGNLAMSGAPYSGVDLGGFKADGLDREVMHSDENIIRRVAHGFLLFPIPRIHNSERAPNKFPWRYSQPVQAVYRRYLELRYALFPYYYSAAVESATEAVPMIRPLAYDHFSDPRTYGIGDVVLVGPSLLMAPIMETGAHSRYVPLPAGTWFDYWTGEKFAGPRQVLVDAPLYARHGLPIFVKQGAILPSRPPAQFNREEPEPVIHLDLYPAESGRYRLWENATTCSELHYTSDGEILTLMLPNNTAISRTFTVACRDGRHIASAEQGGRTLPVSGERVEFLVAPGATAEVILHLR